MEDNKPGEICEYRKAGIQKYNGEQNLCTTLSLLGDYCNVLNRQKKQRSTHFLVLSPLKRKIEIWRRMPCSFAVVARQRAPRQSDSCLLVLRWSSFAYHPAPAKFSGDWPRLLDGWSFLCCCTMVVDCSVQRSSSMMSVQRRTGALTPLLLMQQPLVLRE